MHQILKFHIFKIQYMKYEKNGSNDEDNAETNPYFER